MSLLRKLTTRPVWKWEKSRPYPIRGRWDRLPGIPARGAMRMVVLTTPSGFGDAMWTLWSWLRFLQDEVRLTLVIDGAVTMEHRAGMERLSPGATMVSGTEIVAAAQAWRRVLVGTNHHVRDLLHHPALPLIHPIVKHVPMGFD